jgi:CshA-type fibril repeat protein
MSEHALSQVDFSHLKPNQSISKLKYSKSTGSSFSIGNHVWYDYNQDGKQDLGEMGIYDVELSLYDNVDCHGTAIASTKSSDVGRYEFKNLSSTTSYCVLAIFPDNFRDLKSNTSITKIENITSFSSDIDFGFFHKNSTCKVPTLVENEKGNFVTSGVLLKQATLNIEFADVKAYAFCHEYNNHGPNTNDEYTAHLIDRLGFTTKQRDRLSRLFRYMSDKDVIEILERDFTDQNADFFFNIMSNAFVWYYVDWSEKFARLELYIDESNSLTNLTKSERTTLKELAHLIVDKVAGTNGKVQYEPMKVYYLWNEDTDERQDLIVPQTSLVPINLECSNPKIQIETSTNGVDSDTATGMAIPLGGVVSWKYEVTNSGNVTLKDIVVTDSKLNEICKVAILEIGESKTCTKEGKAVEGQYSNIGTVKAKSPQDVEVTDSDKSHYLGDNKSEEPKREPIANNDSKVGERCKGIILDILLNDRDAENDINASSVNFMVVDGVTGTDSDNDGDIDTLVVPDEGTWTVNTDGQVTYLPNNDCSQNPSAIFYTVKDKTEAISNKATITFSYPNALKASLGNFVWFDADKNGQQDEGESGLEGISIELYDSNDELNQTTSTDENGTYRFVNLDAGAYVVKFMVKNGFAITVENAEKVDDVNNSDVDVSTGKTAMITLNEGDNRVDIDAGMYQIPKPSIEIVKTTNGGEIGNILVGDMVTWSYVISNRGNVPLLDVLISDDKEGIISDCTGDAVLNPTKSIICTKVGTAILGTYTNKVVVTAHDEEDNNVTHRDESSYVGQETPIEKGSIGNFVWLDTNMNGLQDAQELGLSGITIQLLDTTNTEVMSTITNDLGKYLFSEVVAGEYSIRFFLPNGYSVTSKDKGDENKDSDTDSSGKIEPFTLAVGQNISFKDMGLYPSLVLLGNKVWYDSNENGIQESSEKGVVVNVSVKLYTQEGTFVKETKTGASGLYEFKDLMAGEYYVVFEIPDTYKVSPQNVGTNRSADSNANSETGKSDIITLVAGVDNRTVDMGLYQEAGKIGDRVWYDSNKNGLQDKNENGVGNVKVELYHVGEAKAIDETKTSATGIYSFEKITPAEYYIVFTTPPAYSISKSNRGDDNKIDSNANQEGRTENFTVVSGTKNSTIDMGVYQNMVSFGDRVWLDTNQDGLQSKGETGVKDIKVIISSAVSDFTKSVLTDENGNYLFTHLSAGEYSVEFQDIPLGYLISKKDVDSNEHDLNDSDVFTNDEKRHVTPVALLTPGKNDLSWDMGIYKTVCLPEKAVLGNLVWDDFNKNGIQDIGESGIANVTATLFNNDTDEKVNSTITDENGLYEFAHLDPEFSYYIQFNIPVGYVVSPQDQDDDIIDSDVDETGRTEVIILSADQINSTVDMGLHHEGSAIGDRVWFDEKNGVTNGIQDEGENGVHDVTVTLYDANGDLVTTTQTNASGAYHFTNVPKGRYTIGFSTLPTGYIFTRSEQGTDEELDSDVNSNGRTEVISINGIHNLTHVDAGIKLLNKGESNNDVKRGVTGKDVIIDVLANDIDGSYNLDASSVRITSISDGATLSEDGKTLTVPNEGVWRVDSQTGAITFSPNSGFVGDPTAISYSVEDSQGNETGAEVEVNYPPVANDDRVNAQIGTTVVVYVTDNDTNTSSPLDRPSVRIIDPSNGDEVETIIVDDEGTWSTNNDGSISFIPLDGLNNNPTSIEYVVREENGDASNRATVTIIYPDAVDDIVNVPANHEAIISVDVGANDSNNTIPSTVTLGCSSEGLKTLNVKNEGVWNVDENGVVSFTPSSGFTGEPKDIEYSVALISGERSNCATVDVRYELLARDDSSTLNIGSVSLINILNNDLGSLNHASVQLVIPNNAPKGTTLIDNGKTLTIPDEGTWSVDNRGIVKFIAQDGFGSAPTPIKYTVENNEGTISNEATITLTQGGLVIVANDDRGVADAGNTIIINVLENDIGDLNRSSIFLVAPDGSLVRTLEVENEGTWRANEEGTVTFTGFAGYVGTPTPIQYVVSNNTGERSTPATITIEGTCVCKAYESSVPAMGQISALLMFLLTLLVGSFLFKEKQKI